MKRLTDISVEWLRRMLQLERLENAELRRVCAGAVNHSAGANPLLLITSANHALAAPHRTEDEP